MPVVMRVIVRTMSIVCAVGVCGRSHCQFLRLQVVAAVPSPYPPHERGKGWGEGQRTVDCSTVATVVAGVTSSRANFLRAPSTQALNWSSLTTRIAIGM